MKGNPEKLDVDMEGRLARIVLSLRFVLMVMMMVMMIVMMMMMIIIIMIVIIMTMVVHAKERGGNVQRGHIPWVCLKQERK